MNTYFFGTRQKLGSLYGVRGTLQVKCSTEAVLLSFAITQKLQPWHLFARATQVTWLVSVDHGQ